MKIFAFGLIVLLAIPSDASAAGDASQDPATPAPAEAGCANETARRGICAAVSNRDQTETEPQKYPYRYQRKIFEASCVDMYRDSDEEIARKVSAMWAKNADKLTCTDTSFDVEKGSIIKYAVNAKFENFIYDVISWKVDLNRIDESDNRTVLDYIQDQIRSYKGLPTERDLRIYYELFRKAGAKHRSEL